MTASHASNDWQDPTTTPRYRGLYERFYTKDDHGPVFVDYFDGRKWRTKPEGALQLEQELRWKKSPESLSCQGIAATAIARVQIMPSASAQALLSE